MEHTEHCKKRMKWGDGECDCKHGVSASGSNELLCDLEFLVNDFDDWLNIKYSGIKTRDKLNVSEINDLKAIALRHYETVKINT